MRILWMSNAPWASTGYGTQTRAAVPRLQSLGHTVNVFSFYGNQGGVLNLGGSSIYPVGNHPYGNDIVGAHMAHSRSDVLITLMDVWVQDHFGRMAQREGWAYCPWLPIDQTPVPKAIVERLEGATLVLPYARFGERELHNAGVTNTFYIPHGVDCDTFHPMDRERCRSELGLPQDKFIIGSVQTNKGFPSRKVLAEQVLAFAIFKRTHPDALLYMHCVESTMQGGIDLPALFANLGLRNGEDVRVSNQYGYTIGWPDSRVAMLYNAFDVLTACRMGEGFGLPIVEAQACGVPVVTANNTTSPELTFAGVMVDKVYPWWTPLNAWASIPDVGAIADAYGEMYDRLQDGDERDAMAYAAREGALAYDWERVTNEHWVPFLERLAKELNTGHNGTDPAKAGQHVTQEIV